ncbi:5-(carboxyamino)imidazole ribonucleotide mutase [Thermoproteota archaeon]
MSKIAVIMGSVSDKEIMKKAVDFLKDNNIQTEVFVASAHRTPEKIQEIAKKIEADFDVVIAGAGMAAHLPGVIASLVSKPVIGVPIDASPFKGLDALLSIVQMPSGIPVATVAVNGAKNAGILAMQILGLKDERIRACYQTFRNSLKGE